MQWFGSPWPSEELRAPVCEDDADRAPNPRPGTLCVLCDREIEPGARGVVMPHLAADNMSAVLRYCHLGCLLSNVGGEGISWREPETGPGKTIRL